MNKLQKIVQFLLQSDRLVVIGHTSPDPDSLGAQKALGESLKKMGKEVLMINSDPIPKRFCFLDPKKSIQVYDETSSCLPSDTAPWSVVIVDSDLPNIGPLNEACLLQNCQKMIVIDHHEGTHGKEPNKYVDQQASSTCQIVYEILQSLPVPPPDNEIAQLLLAGIAYDSGFFIYPKTTQKTFEVVKDLVGLGASTTELFDKLYQNSSTGILFLHGHLMRSLELFYEDRVGMQYLPHSLFATYKANYEDSKEFSSYPLRAKTIVLSILFKESPKGNLHCSIRSKYDCPVSCAELAAHFGGGGHKTSSGFLCVESYERTKKSVLQFLEEYFPPLDP